VPRRAARQRADRYQRPALGRLRDLLLALTTPASDCGVGRDLVLQSPTRRTRSFLRDADWLGPARARGYLWIFALLNLTTVLIIVVTSRGGVDRNGFLLGTDFLSFWTSGRMLHSQGSVYDVAAHIAAQ